jgi:tetratricopeptide (TPR) repeat protein
MNNKEIAETSPEPAGAETNGVSYRGVFIIWLLILITIVSFFMWGPSVLFRIASQDPEKFFRSGYQAFNKGDYETARDDFFQAVILRNEEARYHFFLGRTYHNLKNFTKAIAALNAAVDLKPEETKYLTQLGWSYYEAKKYEKAVESWQTTVQLNPQYSAGYYNLGLVSETMGNEKTAEDFYNRCLDIPPRNHEGALHLLGKMKLRQGNMEEAKILLEKAVTVDITNDDAYYNLGRIYYGQGNMESAVKNFNRAVRFGQDNFYYNLELGLAYMNLGKYNIAAIHLERARKIRPDNPQVIKALKEIEGKAGPADPSENKSDN